MHRSEFFYNDTFDQKPGSRDHIYYCKKDKSKKIQKIIILIKRIKMINWIDKTYEMSTERILQTKNFIYHILKFLIKVSKEVYKGVRNVYQLPYTNR